MFTALKNRFQHLTRHPPVDAVYLWVNAADPKLQALKKTYGYQPTEDNKKYKLKTEPIELKYSLRSLFTYAPWINNIYIVTNDQIPGFLNTRHPKIKMVSLNDIVPPTYLPCFNSAVIECMLHRIPNLSEQCIYWNDDMFLGKPLRYRDCFSKKYGETLSLEKWEVSETNAKEDLFLNALWNSNQIIKKKYGPRVTLTMTHTPRFIQKSIYKEMMETFNPEFATIFPNRFRSKSDIVPIQVYMNYRLATAKTPSRLLNLNGLKNYFFCYLPEHISKQSLDTALNIRPRFICINNEYNQKQQGNILDFLEAYFPNPSPVEKQAN